MERQAGWRRAHVRAAVAVPSRTRGDASPLVSHPPGGLYRLLKQGAARGRQLNWSDAYFDLVVVDEASQMNLAEALTATAFLRDDGQFLAVGDHRQMPPILQHGPVRTSVSPPEKRYFNRLNFNAL